MVAVRIYNASRQRLRVSKKTNIAKVLLCKNTAFDGKVIKELSFFQFSAS